MDIKNNFNFMHLIGSICILSIAYVLIPSKNIEPINKYTQQPSSELLGYPDVNESGMYISVAKNLEFYNNSSNYRNPEVQAKEFLNGTSQIINKATQKLNDDHTLKNDLNMIHPVVSNLLNSSKVN